MKKFFNFQFIKKAASVVLYLFLMAMLLADVFSNSAETSHQHHLLWWTMFLTVDIWFFGNNNGRLNEK